MAEGARDAAHARHHGRAALRVGGGGQVDDPLAVGPRTGDPQAGGAADQQAVAGTAHVLLAGGRRPHRLERAAQGGQRTATAEWGGTISTRRQHWQDFLSS